MSVCTFQSHATYDLNTCFLTVLPLFILTTEEFQEFPFRTCVTFKLAYVSLNM